jgi:hypothetical protein
MALSEALQSERASWLLLIKQVPPAPAYLRVKVGRRLAKVGAVALKAGVFALPDTDAALEDFQWIAREVVELGGEATITTARLLDGMSDEDVRGLFRRARESDYGELAAAARQVAADADAAGGDAAALRRELMRLQRRLEELMALDFFAADGRAEAEAALMALRGRMGGPGGGAPQPDDARRTGRYRGRTWVTRTGVKVDRIASAWLIRRFIDPEARFKFVPAQGYVPEPDELRFDMFEAEFTHKGDACTFEVLLGLLDAPDPALAAIGEIVHDIDLKDGKFARPEAWGVAALIDGLCARRRDDDERLARGGAALDDLYASLARVGPGRS